MELKPCPFCGCVPLIQLCDNEGNFKPLDYLENPYSGIKYGIRHDVGRADGDCPIITSVGELLGGYLYNSLDLLESTWNRRVNNVT